VKIGVLNDHPVSMRTMAANIRSKPRRWREVLGPKIELVTADH